MQRAVDVAEQARKDGEVPVGCIFTDLEGNELVFFAPIL